MTFKTIDAYTILIDYFTEKIFVMLEQAELEPKNLKKNDRQRK